MSSYSSISLHQIADYIRDSVSSLFQNVDSINEIKLVGTAVLIASIMSAFP